MSPLQPQWAYCEALGLFAPVRNCSCNFPFKVVKMLFQLRSVNNYVIKITLGNATCCIDPRNVFTQCNRGVNENLLHILRYYPIYHNIRGYVKINDLTASEVINNQTMRNLFVYP